METEVVKDVKQAKPSMPVAGSASAVEALNPADAAEEGTCADSLD
jgi:hypothetical protein